MLIRPGGALAELIVAMTMLAIVGAVAASALAQQGRVRTRIASRTASEVQLREAVTPLVADLGAASPPDGDFRAGQLRDSTLELRATIGTGYVCDDAHAAAGHVQVAPISRQVGRDVQPGDTAWLYQAGAWHSAGVVEVDEGAGACAVGWETDDDVMRITLSRDIGFARGTPVRFTRRIRYSLYRAGDGGTYLGLREWSSVTGAFSGLQPVAGPFDRKRSRFSYLDSLGMEVPSGIAAGTEVRAVVLELWAARPSMAGASDTLHVPRVLVTVGLRNHR